MISKIKRILRQKKTDMFLNKQIQCIYGNVKKKEIKEDEITITCLFQNGAKFIPSFMEHHQKMGVKHFLFLDNSSSDNSIELLKQYNNVTIFSSDLPYKDYKWVFKQFLTKKVGEHKWTLYLDIDELWDYPYSDKISIKSFIKYLNQNNFSGVMSQMLDMYPKTELENVEESGDLLIDYPMYSVANINKTPYVSKVNKVNSSNLFHHRGGIHNTIFGIDDIYLTKIPLIKWNKRIEPHLTSHTSSNVNIADVSTALYHFKFTKDFYLKIEKVIKDGSYWNGSATYKKYKEFIENNKGLNLNEAPTKELKNINQLIEDEFIVISDNFLNFVKINSK